MKGVRIAAALIGVTTFSTIVVICCLHFRGSAHVVIVNVYPGDAIQHALEKATQLDGKKIIRVHAGIYRPTQPGEALVYLNARHDGIILEAVGDVTLTAANAEIADPDAASFPAVVNHVVYLGDGLSNKTVLRGFKITGANGFNDELTDLFEVQKLEDLARADKFLSDTPSAIESNQDVPLTFYFYNDGGGILVYGRSYPTLENVEIHGNYSDVCGAGVSVQHHLARFAEPVRFKNCTFRNNRAAVSGSAADLLSPGSWASFDNCLFVGNASNAKIPVNYGAVTVFPMSRATVRNCTFTGNRNGVVDRGLDSTYARSIFWNNNLTGGAGSGPHFDLLINNPAAVRNCFFTGGGNGFSPKIDPRHNRWHAPDPSFDKDFIPRHAAYREVGYRPAGIPK